MITKYQKNEVSQITLLDFKNCITECIDEGLNNFAPMGASGTGFLLFTKFDEKVSEVRRDRQLTIGLHNSNVQMLLTDYMGRFIFYGSYNKSIGVDFIAEQHFSVFKKLRHQLIEKPY